MKVWAMLLAMCAVTLAMMMVADAIGFPRTAAFLNGLGWGAVAHHYWVET